MSALDAFLNNRCFAGNIDDSHTRGIYLRTDIVVGSNFDSLAVQIKKADLNTIVFDIKDMKGRVYIDIENCPTLISQKYDLKIDLDNTIKKIHDKGFRAVTRVVVFHNKRAAASDSSFCPRYENGKRWIESSKKGPLWLDPSDSTVQSDMLKLLDKLVNAGVDEVQFDYIRFPTQGKAGDAVFDFVAEDNRRSFRDSTYIKRTKMDIIESFLERVRERFAGRNTRFTADLFAIVSWQNKADINATGQDIARMTAYLDAIHPMIYSSHFASNFGYRKQVNNEPFDIIFKGVKKSMKKVSGDCKVIPYIQANSWKVNYKKEYMAAQLAACEAAKTHGFILWNATINYKTTLGWIAELNK